MHHATAILLVLLTLCGSASAGGIALVDATGASHGTAVASLPKGTVRLTINSLPPLPSSVNTGTETFTAQIYRAYLSSSTDPAVEISLGDLYPSGRQKAKRKIALGGDVSHMGLNRITVTAFSKDGQQSFDVLTGKLAP